jgi:hypothetical protein
MEEKGKGLKEESSYQERSSNDIDFSVFMMLMTNITLLNTMRQFPTGCKLWT